VFRFAVLTQNPSSEDVASVLFRMRSAVRGNWALVVLSLSPHFGTVSYLMLYVIFQATAMTEPR
jgi:hypothetical protein